MSRNRTNYNNKYNPKNDYNTKEEEVVVEEDAIEEEKKSVVLIGKVDIPVGKELNVRSKDSKDSDPVTTINRDSDVVILSNSNDFGDWFKICTATGIEGYVLKEFIKDIHETTIE